MGPHQRPHLPLRAAPIIKPPALPGRFTRRQQAAQGLFDLSKTSPESLDYAGKPVFETRGLTKRYVAPVFYGPPGPDGIIDSERVIAEAGIGRLTIAQWRKQSVEVQAALEAALPKEKRLRNGYVETRTAEDVARAKAEADAKGEPFDETHEDAVRKRSHALWSGAACHELLAPISL